jgi:2-haloacid dehalogenase
MVIVAVLAVDLVLTLLAANLVGPAAFRFWDVRGASRAGCRTCFVRRPEQVLDELTPKPDFVVSDLHELTNQLTRAKKAA